ncbi:HNH endonuclease signature motif containing protein [Streptomyces sp. NPDC014622]|uniref:HNH endonuclease signature motif containing protein n=1 Tax=Streptomyces sp. NPDC014622 TaxID=3364874 RepID=UPI0036FF4E46
MRRKAGPARTCEFPDCMNLHDSLGLCSGHRRQRRRGEELRSLREVRPRNLSDEEISNWMLDRAVVVGECLVYSNYKDKRGYGRFNHAGKYALAHRFIYAQKVGPLDDALVVHHKCGNSSCINPKHLQAVTQLENVAEMLDRTNMLRQIEAQSVYIERLKARIAASSCYQ